MAYPIICLHIFLDAMYSCLLWGFLSSRASVGGSVAKASEANVSMMRLTLKTLSNKITITFRLVSRLLVWQ